MTTYGTIPTAPPDSSNFEFIVSRAKERIRSGLGTRRPWKEMVSVYTITIPSSFEDSLSRIRTNAGYFLANYAIIVLFALFLSLLCQPISLIVFFGTMAAWLFFYFLRDEPLVIFNRIIDDRVVLIVLSVVTIVSLFLTHATVNIVVGLVVGALGVLVHGALRRTDDLLLDEEEEVGSDVGWCSGGGARMILKETASSSFSSSS